MRRSLMVCFLALFIAMLCACGGSVSTNPTSYSRSDIEPEETPAEVYTGNGSEWCASLFAAPSTEYSEQLALVAAEMCEASENNIDNDLSIRKLYSRYGLYACEYQNFDEIDGMNFVISDSAAFAIGQDTLNINGIDTTILVITARGTKNLYESLGDWLKGGEVDFLGTRVWKNAYDFEEKIWNGIDEYINKYPALKEVENLKILVTGHSLGGAAANLIGARFMNSDGFWWDDKTSQNDIYVYTYGAIKTLTSEKNISKGYENIHNLFNYYDSFGPEGNFSILNASSFYAKYGHTDLYRNEADKITADSDSTSIDSHLMANYKAAISDGLVECTAYDEQYGKDINSDIPPSSNAESTKGENMSISVFEIKGKWKNIGQNGFGQAQPGAIIIFDERYCNFYSPQDTYTLYEENGKIRLDCTSYFFAENLSFRVEITDSDNITIYYGSEGVQLKRVG